MKIFLLIYFIIALLFVISIAKYNNETEERLEDDYYNINLIYGIFWFIIIFFFIKFLFERKKELNK